MDRAWWNQYAVELPEGPELWTTNREASRIWGLNYVHGEPGGGLAQRRDSIRMGGNSGFQALGLALYFGAAHVVLLGYDMQLTGGRTHWHGDHKSLGNPMSEKVRGWHKHFAELPAATRARVINSTRQTALRCFERQDLLTALSI